MAGEGRPSTSLQRTPRKDIGSRANPWIKSGDGHDDGDNSLGHGLFSQQDTHQGNFNDLRTLGDLCVDSNHHAGMTEETLALLQLRKSASASPIPAGAASGADLALLAAEAESSIAGRRRRWLRRYGLAAAGGALILFWLLAAVLAPDISPYPPDVVHVAGRLAPPSAAHWLGTDELGRDVLTRVLYGARTSLMVGFVVVLAGAAFGSLLGAVAAYIRGWAEEALMRATDLMFCFPPIILAMAIAAALGIGTRNTVIAMLVVWWPKFARLARSVVIGQRSQEYVAAAQTVGFGPAHILLRQIVPNAVGPLIVLVTLDLGNAILVFAGLSFLGLGVVPPTPEWGSMVSEGRELVSQWWVATFPGLAILSVVMGFNFVGDGLRDWLDPHARRR